jgi:hypothetical protein
VGSFGTRVNFFAQQNRALNLVWALYEDGHIGDREHVAVIGGGVTGLTVAVALMSHGCTVDVYEHGNVAIPRQATTDHRFVHPTINAWPSKDPEITTRLPFMEWHIGQCDVIAEKLKDRFEEIKTVKSSLLTGVGARRVMHVATHKVVVKSSHNPEPVYRLAIIAAGFGEERVYEDIATDEYWTPDGLERERNKGKYDDYVVSGCGDGGLIDALRIAHFEFGKGMLAFDTAADLTGTPLALMIAEAEADVAHNFDSTNPSASASKLAQVYADAAELLYSDPLYHDVQKRLLTSLNRFVHPVITLTDNVWDPPVSPSSAPIHKLLVAHARRAAKLEYSAGKLLIEPDHYRVRGRIFRPKEKTKIVVRHGADARKTLDNLLEDFEVNDLEAKQLKESEFLAEAQWDQPFPAIGSYPSYDTTNEDFIVSRMDDAQQAVATLDKSAELVKVVGGFEVTFNPRVPSAMRGPLFGIPTAAYPTPVSRRVP